MIAAAGGGLNERLERFRGVASPIMKHATATSVPTFRAFSSLNRLPTIGGGDRVPEAGSADKRASKSSIMATSVSHNVATVGIPVTVCASAPPRTPPALDGAFAVVAVSVVAAVVRASVYPVRSP